MLKVLKVTVVLQFVAALVALVLGIMLFNRRQVLLGRTAALERGLTMVAATLETAFPTADDQPPIERDVDSVSAERLAKPLKGDFWHTYDHTLELSGTRILDLKDQRRALLSFFKIDPVTDKPMRDTVTGQHIASGPGTTRGVIDDVVISAEEQLNRLNTTRQQLLSLREEYQETTGELNERKQQLREALCGNVDRQRRIELLQVTIVAHKDTMNEKDSEISDLRGRLVDAEHALGLLREDSERQKDNIVFWKNRYHELLGRDEKRLPREWTAMNRGTKGRILSVDHVHDFVIMQLEQQFLKDYSKAVAQDPTISPPSLMVTRKSGGEDTFIAKVELGAVDMAQGLGVGSVLASWKQEALRVNDAIIY